ncbi:MAG TPA: amino acid permease [Rubricoccaceae bacterium]|jgi:amino acid transporter
MALPLPDLVAAGEPATAGPSSEGLVRALGVRALSANAVNGCIGSGIFLLPATVAGALGPAAIVAYVACAVAIGLVVACFAEAGSRVARSGGAYAYAETAFGPYVGFVVGTVNWLALVSSLAAVAAALVAVAAEVAAPLTHPAVRIAVLGGMIGGFAWVNVRGVREGARFAVTATVAKLLPLAVLIGFGLPAVRAENLAWTSVPTPSAFGSGSLLLIFAFVGTEGALTSSGEIRDPARTVPRAIALAMAVVLAFYLALQVVAQGVLGPDLPRSTAAPLAEAAGRVLGAPGRALLLAGAAISMLGYVVGDLLASPRALFAQARDGFLVAPLARVHPTHRTPHVAIWTYAAVAFALAATGTFERLASLAVVALLTVFLAVCSSVLVLRRRGVAQAGTPYQTPGGPLVPVLAVVLVLGLLAQATAPEFLALGAVVAMATALYPFRRKQLVAG